MDNEEGRRGGSGLGDVTSRLSGTVFSGLSSGMARRLFRVATTIVASEMMDEEREDRDDSSLPESKQM